MEAPHLPHRLFLRNFTSSSIFTSPSMSSSPTAQLISTTASLTSQSTTLQPTSSASHSTSPTSTSTTNSISISPTSSSTFLSTSTTSTLTSSPTSLSTSTFSPTPIPSPKPTHPSPPKHTTSNIALYTGIALSLFFLALLIFLLLRLDTYLYRRRQRAKLLSSIPLNPHENTSDGLRPLQLPQLIHSRHHNHNSNDKNKKGDKKGNRRSRLEYQDGRRFGVVGLGLDNVGEGDGEGVQSFEVGRRNREVFEEWKRRRGFVDFERGGVVLEEPGEGEGSDGTGRRERRETFDAWKRGVVPPLKGEGEVGGRAESGGSERELGTRVLGGVGLSFRMRDGEEVEVQRQGDDYDTRKQRQVVDEDTPNTGQGASV
ncbi:hypothetical protein L207DRAFT_169201 [Hyaloscypha variabilis F]|uniref:Uncharacterized protein n=1 Tax=Hyaloscypha variabilis (strain UAMH 11265 / GT02V1 / F) TaxID=1149755 RepID=A0A2J6R443_HYAVF|nr:hypothetical protein L207DRAFT_169201 [Hyaloscypha variabilis F]